MVAPRGPAPQLLAPCCAEGSDRWGGSLGPPPPRSRGVEILEQDSGLPGPKSVRLDCWPGVKNWTCPLPLPILARGHLALFRPELLRGWQLPVGTAAQAGSGLPDIRACALSPSGGKGRERGPALARTPLTSLTSPAHSRPGPGGQAQVSHRCWTKAGDAPGQLGLGRAKLPGSGVCWGLGKGPARVPEPLTLKTNLLPIYSSKKAGTTAKGKVGGRWK